MRSVPPKVAGEGIDNLLVVESILRCVRQTYQLTHLALTKKLRHSELLLPIY
jgi:hypothetical protein